MMDFREFLKAFGETYAPAMRFDGRSSEECRAWQDRFLATLERLSGDALGVRRRRHDAPPVAPRVTLLDRAEEPDHVRERIAIESVLGTTVPAYVLVPKSPAAGPRPGVLALHGHTPRGKAKVAGVSEPGGYGLAAVRAGYVTLCPDWWGFGERLETGFDFEGQDACNVKFVAAAMYGLPLLTLMLHDAQAALDVLLARPDVDPRRVAVIGNSFGGRMSMYLAAFDERLAGAACSGCLNCFRERSLNLTSCGAQFFPGLLRFGDVEDLFALIAPRPLLILTGRADPLIPHEWAERMKPVIRRAYDAFGAADRLTFHDHPGPHVLPLPPLLAWLARLFSR